MLTVSSCAIVLTLSISARSFMAKSQSTAQAKRLETLIDLPVIGYGEGIIYSLLNATE